MTEESIQDLHARFEREAFYLPNGRPRLTPEIKLTDLAWVMIDTHHSYAHEWWKEYTGLVILAKLIFHKTPQNWHFLYEVIPVKISGYSVCVSRSITANCVHVIEPANYATGSHVRAALHAPFDECRLWL